MRGGPGRLYVYSRCWEYCDLGGLGDLSCAGACCPCPLLSLTMGWLTGYLGLSHWPGRAGENF